MTTDMDTLRQAQDIIANNLATPYFERVNLALLNGKPVAPLDGAVVALAQSPLFRHHDDKRLNTAVGKVRRAMGLGERAKQPVKTDPARYALDSRECAVVLEHMMGHLSRPDTLDALASLTGLKSSSAARLLNAMMKRHRSLPLLPKR